MVSTNKYYLPRTAPEHQGMSSSAVLQFVDAIEAQIHEIHSFMLMRHGAVIAEGWWSPYNSQSPHLLFSVSKSFTSTAVGLAIAEGRFSIDDSVLDFFPENTPDEVSQLLSSMRVRHLLSMSTGQAEDTWSYMVGRPDGNWIKGFLNVPVLHTPGTHFLYNTGATYMLSAIIQKTTGMKLLDYLQPRLFEPLGIENATWQESPQGITAGGIGLSLKTEDIARFGQLYLQKGKWQGQEVLSEIWVEEATHSQVSKSNGMQIDWMQGYGYQFWRSRHGAYRGDGVFGQYCIIMPEQDAVLAITGGMDIFDMQQPLNLVWDLLLPAMSSDPLPDNPIGYNVLTDKLSNLAMQVVQGKSTSPIASQVSGKTYVLDKNILNIETIRFDFTGSDCTIRVKTNGKDEALPCGYATWLHGKTVLFSQPLLFDNTPTAICGAWATDTTFKMVIRLYETPFFHTVICDFMDDELMIEIQINVSMESLNPILLTAHSI